jgi:hypothetical protein
MDSLFLGISIDVHKLTTLAPCTPTGIPYISIISLEPGLLCFEKYMPGNCHLPAHATEVTPRPSYGIRSNQIELRHYYSSFFPSPMLLWLLTEYLPVYLPAEPWHTSAVNPGIHPSRPGL